MYPKVILLEDLCNLMSSDLDAVAADLTKSGDVSSVASFAMPTLSLFSMDSIPCGTETSEIDTAITMMKRLLRKAKLYRLAFKENRTLAQVENLAQ